MGALMVIFSLQPKQKAKTKGRLSVFTSTPEDSPPSPRSNLLHHQCVKFTPREPESKIQEGASAATSRNRSERTRVCAVSMFYLPTTVVPHTHHDSRSSFVLQQPINLI